MRTGLAQLPLHGGKAPRWLFSRMVRLAREVVCHITAEYGPDEILVRLSDPYWFQALGCALGFDWHSSGVTTTTCGAIKEGIRGLEKDLGFYAAGGKGAASRKTPQEIITACERLSYPPDALVYASRLSAKVDNRGCGIHLMFEEKDFASAEVPTFSKLLCEGVVHEVRKLHAKLLAGPQTIEIPDDVRMSEFR